MRRKQEQRKVNGKFPGLDGGAHSLSGKMYRAELMLEDLESGVHFLVNRLCLFQKQTQVELL